MLPRKEPFVFNNKSGLQQDLTITLTGYITNKGLYTMTNCQIISKTTYKSSVFQNKIYCKVQCCRCLLHMIIKPRELVLFHQRKEKARKRRISGNGNLSDNLFCKAAIFVNKNEKFLIGRLNVV